MTFAVWFAVVTPIILATTWWMGRPGRWRWTAFYVAALVALPVVAASLGVGQTITPFRVLKTLSVGAAGLLVARMRTRREAQPRMAWALWAIFAFNILQAAVVETLSHNWMNPLAGILLVLGISTPRHLSTEHGRVDWELGWRFLAAYTVWNLVFVYTSAPPDEALGQWTGLALPPLVVPLVLAAMGGTARWGEARIISLFLVMTLLDYVPEPPWAVPTYWHHPTLATAGQVAGLVSVLGLLASQLRTGERLDSPMSRLGRRLRSAGGS